MAFASDTFTGTDGTVLETYSANWTKIAGGSGWNLAINANTIYCILTGTGWQMHYWNSAQAITADYDVQAVVARAAGNDSIGPAGRLSIDNNNGYFVKYVSGAGWVLSQRSGGTVTQIGATYNGDDPTTPRTVLLRMVGTQISVLINGVVRIGPATGAVTAKGYAGVGSYYSGVTTSFYLDSFVASDPVAAGPSISGGTAAPIHGSTGNTITGSSFGASQGTGTLVIGGQAQTVTAWSDISITYTANRGINLDNVAVNAVVSDNAAAASANYALTGFAPPVGYSVVTLTSVNATAANRITAVADLAIGDQLEWDNINVTINADGTWNAAAGVTAFNVRGGVTASGWGALASQTINASISSGTRGVGIRLGLGL
jgi:hypothetical protein